MNLIGNCCISNHLLRKYGYGNTNPFTWINMDFTSFYNLLTEWTSIDFSIIDFIRIPHPWIKSTYQYSLLIDDKVKLDYVHYVFDPYYTSPKVNGVDVKYCKIWEYILNQYNKHVDIMKQSNLPPQFVLEWEHMDYRENEFDKLLNTELKYKVAVITYNKKYANISKENLLVIYDDKKRGRDPNGSPPLYFANKYHNTIFNFLIK